jgi:hypothetical protein
LKGYFWIKGNINGERKKVLELEQRNNGLLMKNSLEYCTIR